MTNPLATEKKRFVLVMLVLASLFLVVFVRLVQLILFAPQGAVRKQDAGLERGQILDREFRKLALSVKVYSVFCDAARTGPAAPDAVRALSGILSVPPSGLEAAFRSGKSFVWLKRQVDYAALKKVLDLKIKGIGYIREYKRFYPNGRLGSHLLGIVGIDNSGLEGLELYYDKYLNSAPDGAAANFSIVLSIDKNIQYIVENELRRKVNASGARSGTAIVMEPDTGYIVALVNVPDFDPNVYARFPVRERKNIAISDTFEPGSIFKIFSAATVYSEKVIGEKEMFFCPGHIQIGSGRLACWKKHGALDFHQVIRQSCNAGMSRAILKISPYRFYEYIRNFGMGNYTGVDLPGEVQGFLRRPKGMGAFSQAAIALGQEVGVTSIQLITAACAVFNGGRIMEPKAVKAIVHPDGSVYKSFRPVTVRQVLSSSVADTVARDLQGVVEEGGTGDLAYVKNFMIAGKTGTGEIFDRNLRQYSPDRVNSSFIGFFPANRVRYAILITIHEPRTADKTGGKVAAPVFRDIVEKIIASEAIPNEHRLIISTQENSSFLNRTYAPAGREGRLPDVSGRNMREVLNILKAYKVKVNLRGTGISFRQTPAAGERVREGMVVTVDFREP